jgi:rhomboid protease GluP
VTPDVSPAPTSPVPPRIALRLPTYSVRVTYLLLGLIGLVFAAQLVSAPFPGDPDWISALGEKDNQLIAAGQLWRLLTPIFIHGSILHFVFNAYALYSLGREIEAFYGPARFTSLFFFAGMCGVTLSLWFEPAPSIGASGAIFGLIGAEAVLLYRNRRLLGERARRGLQNIIVIAGLNLLIGLQGAMRIDNWGHLGGLLGGALMAWFIGPVWALPQTPSFGAPVAALDDRQPLDAPRWLMIGALNLGLLALIGLAVVRIRLAAG